MPPSPEDLNENAANQLAAWLARVMDQHQIPPAIAHAGMSVLMRGIEEHHPEIGHTAKVPPMSPKPRVWESFSPEQFDVLDETQAKGLGVILKPVDVDPGAPFPLRKY